MKVPSNRGYQPRPAAPKAGFDPYMAIAIAMRAEASEAQPGPPALPEPRPTAEARVGEPEPAPMASSPEEPVAEVVDLGEERARRAPVEIDHHAEIMGQLAQVNEIREAMDKLTQGFAAANDGSTQMSISDGLSAVSEQYKGLKADLSGMRSTVRSSVEAQAKAMLEGLQSSRSATAAELSQARAAQTEALDRMAAQLQSFDKRVADLMELQQRLESTIKAPKRIIRDAKGRAVGSVVDPNLK